MEGSSRASAAGPQLPLADGVALSSSLHLVGVTMGRAPCALTPCAWASLTACQRKVRAFSALRGRSLKRETACALALAGRRGGAKPKKRRSTRAPTCQSFPRIILVMSKHVQASPQKALSASEESLHMRRRARPKHSASEAKCL